MQNPTFSWVHHCTTDKFQCCIRGSIIKLWKISILIFVLGNINTPHTQITQKGLTALQISDLKMILFLLGKHKLQKQFSSGIKSKLCPYFDNYIVMYCYLQFTFICVICYVESLSKTLSNMLSFLPKIFRTGTEPSMAEHLKPFKNTLICMHSDLHRSWTWTIMWRKWWTV